MILVRTGLAETVGSLLNYRGVNLQQALHGWLGDADGQPVNIDYTFRQAATVLNPTYNCCFMHNHDILFRYTKVAHFHALQHVNTRIGILIELRTFANITNVANRGQIMKANTIMIMGAYLAKTVDCFNINDVRMAAHDYLQGRADFGITLQTTNIGNNRFLTLNDYISMCFNPINGEDAAGLHVQNIFEVPIQQVNDNTVHNPNVNKIDIDKFPLVLAQKIGLTLFLPVLGTISHLIGYKHKYGLTRNITEEEMESRRNDVFMHPHTAYTEFKFQKRAREEVPKINRRPGSNKEDSDDEALERSRDYSEDSENEEINSRDDGYDRVKTKEHPDNYSPVFGEDMSNDLGRIQPENYVPIDAVDAFVAAIRIGQALQELPLLYNVYF